MARNQAIVIGINQYEFLQPLDYAKRDALLMQDFFTQQAGFEKVWFFSDDSPAIGGKSTRPTLVNLQRMLRQVFERPFLGDGDNFWFFFSGHGVPHEGRDYLMAADSDPEDVQRYGIATAEISDRLRRCGADNVVMILDACRKGGRRAGEGIGAETAEKGKQTGVVSLFSCSPDQFSYEFESIEQGAFTKALLEGLGTQGRCATVERLNLYLERRVPEITREFGMRQNPYTIAEPIEKSHLILLPQYATLADVQTLKLEAFQAESDRLYHKAEQVWIRVLAASPADPVAVEAIRRLARLNASIMDLPLDNQSTGVEPIAVNLLESQVAKSGEAANQELFVPYLAVNEAASRAKETVEAIETFMGEFEWIWLFKALGFTASIPLIMYIIPTIKFITSNIFAILGGVFILLFIVGFLTHTEDSKHS